MKTKKTARTLAAGAAVLMIVGGLSACSTGPGDTAIGAAQAYLNAIAEGNAEQVAELSGLTSEDLAISALGSATERISDPIVTSPEPTPSPDSDQRVSLGVSYTLARQQVESELTLERPAGGKWLANALTGTIGSLSDDASVTVGSATGAAVAWQVFPGVYPVEVPALAFTDVSDSVTVVRPGETYLPEMVLQQDAFMEVAVPAVQAAIKACGGSAELASVPTPGNGVVCTGQTGFTSKSHSINPLGREFTYGELEFSELPNFEIGSLALPTVWLDPMDTFTMEQDVTGTLKTLGSSITSRAFLKATVSASAEVILGPDGIASILITGDSSVTGGTP